MRIVISAGPTREAIDPVRFITNRSTGKMGYAIARAAVQMKLQTVLVSGPVNLAPPEGVEFVPVESAAEMAEAMKKAAADADIIARGSLFDEPRFLELLIERSGERFVLPDLPPIYGACVECLRLNGIAATDEFYKKFAAEYKTKSFV